MRSLTDTPLKVYLPIRHRRELTGAPAVTVSALELETWHLSRHACYRALDRLEADGLATVERRPGRPTLGTLRV